MYIRYLKYEHFLILMSDILILQNICKFAGWNMYLKFWIFIWTKFTKKISTIKLDKLKFKKVLKKITFFFSTVNFSLLEKKNLTEKSRFFLLSYRSTFRTSGTWAEYIIFRLMYGANKIHIPIGSLNLYFHFKSNGSYCPYLPEKYCAHYTIMLVI